MSKKPLWLKSNCVSCPECGKLADLQIFNYEINNNKGFNCRFCKIHLSEQDFWEDFMFKAGFSDYLEEIYE